MDESDRKLREQLKRSLMESELDEAQAEVLLRRIADRLGGYTHDEVVKRHPMPGRE